MENKSDFQGDFDNENVKKKKGNGNIIDLRPLFEWYQATGRKWPKGMPIVSTRLYNGNKQKEGESNDK